jgi:arylsulfatase A-like enzyme
LYYPNFLNRYSTSLGDTATVRVIMDENINYPMFGKDYAKRSQYSADIIHREAIKWLDKQDTKHPFFGIFTYTLPHAELAQPEDSLLLGYEQKFFVDKTWGGDKWSRYNAVVHTHAQFAAMITRLDSYVGEILAKLKEKGLDDNTIVIFTSDNGPHEEGGADPQFFGRDGKLRGLKRQCYEGGIRIPFIVRWPGKVAPGTTNDHQLAFYDIMPTFCDLIGVKNYVKKYTNHKKKGTDYFDGISFAPTLLGNGKQEEHEFLYWEFDETDQIGVRMGDWKLVVKKGEPLLYNLADDIHEDNDIAAQHPDIVQQMINIIHAQHTPNPNFTVTIP